MQWNLYPDKPSDTVPPQGYTVRFEERLFASFIYFVKAARKKYLLPEEEVFDAYSDAILHTVANIKEGKFEHRSTIKTYLHRIFHNKCVDRVRKKATKKEKPHEALYEAGWISAIPDPAKSVVEKLADEYDARILRQKMEQLGKSNQQLLQLFSEGYSDREIAEIMGYKSPDVVKTTRLRCLEKLRRLYNTKK